MRMRDNLKSRLAAAAARTGAYILARSGEASTWRGLAMILTAVGYDLSADQVNAFVSNGLAVVGLIGLLFPDRAKAA